MKFLFSKKFNLIRDFLSALLLTLLIMILLIINAFHDAEHFTDTTIVNNATTEQADKIYEYCIEPNAFNIRHAEYTELFNDTKFLDPNYQFVIKTDIKSFQSIPDGSLEKYSYTYVGTNLYTIYDTFNRRDVNIYIESYISTEHFKQGHIYNCYQKFDIIDRYFTIIIITFVILLLLLIVNLVHMLFTRFDKDYSYSYVNWLNNIYYEIPLIIFLLLLEANSSNNVVQFSFTNYFTIFMKLYLLIVTGMLLFKTTCSRLSNKIFLNKSFILKSAIFLGKFFKQIFGNLEGRIRCIIILVASLIVEAALIYTIYNSNEESFYILWPALKLVQAILLLHYFAGLCKLTSAAKDMQAGATNVKINTKYMYGLIKEHAIRLNNISIGLDKAVEEKIKSEQLKTELITNVSHDLKTPLTSIINYVDLMKKETTDNDKISEYLEVLDKQSQRLKTLTENVIEASKAATGNMKVNIGEVNINEILSQALGEYENKFKELNISTIYNSTDTPLMVNADGQLLWRVLDNLFSNVCKYTMESTRVYIDITDTTDYHIISIKNISKYQLNISAEELMQRFVRGDSSRSTNGNGLGLSIAQSFMTLQGGKLELDINGDLFVANVYIQKRGV